jgi:crotonobetainyl-CoA:carnitine CoA-transferase CaiB-like acyl-CoA transferase
MDKLGFGYDAARAIKPDIVYASASGYGADGPYRDRPGQDLVIQALSGLANINGSVDQPPTPVGVSAADHHGAQILAMSILAALFKKERTGKGCKVDIDLLSAALDLQMESLVCYANGEPVTQRPPNNIAGWYFPAPYGFYQVADGYVAISLGSMEALSKALSVPELAGYDHAATFTNNGDIAALIQAAVKDLTTDQLEEKLESQKLWYSRVNAYDDVLADPQVQHNGSFMEVESSEGSPLTLLGHPAKYDGERPGVRLPPQPVGAQTQEILAEIGYSDSAVADLAGAGIVRVHESQGS